MKIFFLPLLFLVCLFSSCSYQKIEFEKQSGKINVVKAGKKFRVSLPEDHKTNFYWGTSHDYNRKMIMYINSVFHGQTVEFNFQALKSGKTEMTFYKAGYKDTAEVKTFVVQVE